MAVIQNNCERCTEYKSNRCDTKVTDCMCKGCPRNLGECLITRYCRETESVICNDEDYYY